LNKWPKTNYNKTALFGSLTNIAWIITIQTV
jgi:hypothetical protein